MTAASVESFNRTAFASQQVLYGRSVVINGTTYLMLVRNQDALEAAAGGFEASEGEIVAQYQGSFPVDLHAMATIGDKRYRVKSIHRSNGRISATLRPLDSTK